MKPSWQSTVVALGFIAFAGLRRLRGRGEQQWKQFLHNLGWRWHRNRGPDWCYTSIFLQATSRRADEEGHCFCGAAPASHIHGSDYRAP